MPGDYLIPSQADETPSNRLFQGHHPFNARLVSSRQSVPVNLIDTDVIAFLCSCPVSNPNTALPGTKSIAISLILSTSEQWIPSNPTSDDRGKRDDASQRRHEEFEGMTGKMTDFCIWEHQS